MLVLKRRNIWLLQELYLLLASSVVGILLAAYDVAFSIWLGTELILLYLAWAGLEAIVLSFAWVVGLIWAGVFQKSWLADIPWLGIPAWTGALGLSWAIGLVLVLSVAFLQRSMIQTGASRVQVAFSLSAIVFLGLHVGQIIYGVILSQLIVSPL